MDETQLTAFLAVYRYGSLKEASRHLHLSQSTVTNRLQALERRLGVVLVDRARGRPHATLTPEGDELLVLAERWEEVTRDVAALTARRDAALSLGAPDSVSHFVLAPILRDLALRHPELVLHVESANSPAIYGKLERREVDLAFVVYERNLPGVLIEPFVSDEMLLLTRMELDERDDLVSHELLDPQREIHIPWGAGYERWRARAFGASKRRLSVETGHLAMALLDGPAWTIVPASMTRTIAPDSGFHVYRLSEPPPPQFVYVARRLQQSRSAVNGMRLFDEAVRQLLPSSQRRFTKE